MSLLKPIHHTLGPHVDVRTALHACGLTFLPWRYRRGKAVGILEQQLQQAFGGQAITFASGREALLSLLRALKLRPGEEVIVQGFTCIVVPNAIHAGGGVPIYVDIDRDTLNLRIDAVRAAITPRTRAVICQHTFGIPADTAALRSLCDSKDLTLIEDCAHILPDAQGPGEIGKHGDFLLLSFGRDKAIFGITGGAILSRKPEVTAAMKREQARAEDLSWWRAAVLLHYPILLLTARPLYGLRAGKALLQGARALGLLLPIVTPLEKEGKTSPIVHRLPNVCALIALRSLKRLQQINDQRRTLTQFYGEHGRAHGWPLLSGIKPDLPLQKFPLFVKDSEGIRRSLKPHNIHLHDGWTGCVVCPEGVHMPSTDYTPGTDPQAESACEHILSLPTHPTMTLRQARKLAEALTPLIAS